MKSVLRSLQALPLAGLGRHPDIVLAVTVAGIVGMLILPLPAPMVDGLLAANLALAAVILVAVLLSPRPLSISTFPTLLLITTLFRLALNVSTTRMILAKGTAGEVVEGFGAFVIRGDIVVGLVIFLVITLVQFMVIGKGAGRVAEVGARFTLDAMPGKQMAIDAALRAGSITEQQADLQRNDLSRESQFYGAMDGAMKFVKGDAVAGLIITALNMVAGFIIGVLRGGMDMASAAETYTILTVGDGLVSQIPALLITLSAGVLTTRVASKDTLSLAGSLQDELLSSPKVLAIGSAFSLALGLVPGLPLVPFVVIALALAIIPLMRWRATRMIAAAAGKGGGDLAAELDAKVKAAKRQQALVDRLAPAVAEIAIDFDPVSSQVLGLDQGDDAELVGTMIPQVRDQLYFTTGVRFPHATVRKGCLDLRTGGFRIRIKDVPVYEGRIDPSKVLAVETPERVRRLGIEGKPEVHPSNGMPCTLVPAESADALRAAGVTVWKVEEIVGLHLMRVLRKHGTSFIGVQETSEMLERLAKVYGALVREVVPKLVTPAQLAEILRRLVDENVSIRDLKSILECLAEYGASDVDGIALTERVRASLSMQIAHAHSGLSGQLPVVLLDGLVEDTIHAGITYVTGGSFLALEPEIRSALHQAIMRTLGPVSGAGAPPVILTTAEIRRYVHTLVAEVLPRVSVVSYQELPLDLTIQPLGRVCLPDELPEAA